jgi:hypothetical protein
MNDLLNLIKPKPKPIKEVKEKKIKLKDIFLYKNKKLKK